MDWCSLDINPWVQKTVLSFPLAHFTHVQYKGAHVVKCNTGISITTHCYQHLILRYNHPHNKSTLSFTLHADSSCGHWLIKTAVGGQCSFRLHANHSWCSPNSVCACKSVCSVEVEHLVESRAFMQKRVQRKFSQLFGSQVLFQQINKSKYLHQMFWLCPHIFTCTCSSWSKNNVTSGCR